MAFLGLEHAGVLGLGDEGLHLFIGHPFIGLTALTEQAQHQFAGNIQEPDQRRGDRRDERHGGRNAGRNAFRIAQGDLLGHQFADYQ